VGEFSIFAYVIVNQTRPTEGQLPNIMDNLVQLAHNYYIDREGESHMPKKSKGQRSGTKNISAYGSQEKPDAATSVTLKRFLESLSGLSTSKARTSESNQKRTNQRHSKGFSNEVAQVGDSVPLSQSIPHETLFAREILEAGFQCGFKLHLRLHGQRDAKSDFEVLSNDSREEVTKEAMARILASNPHSDIPVGVRVTSSLLKRGHPFILNATFLTEFGDLQLEGLKKVSGFSRLGDFHYLPIICYEGQKIRKEQRLLLEFCALLISRLQAAIPNRGVIYHGRECRLTTLRLSTDLNRGRSILEEMRRSRNSEHAPKLILNNHCNIFEFMKQCRRQAIEEDNLSLLGGIGEKELKKYARKGIFTISQLSHTFRPRRKGKRQEQSRHHNQALQAMALRDNTVYVLGTPKLPISPVRVYFDVEGDPEEDYIYLIGMIVSDGISDTSCCFWADNRDQEVHIFKQFLSRLREIQDFALFCYGGYEKTFLKKMRHKIKPKKDIDRVLEITINTLSLIYSHVYFPSFTNGLKDIGRYLGCQWTDEHASGIQSIVWRRTWEDSHDEEWKQRLITYNLEDCAALKKVTQFLYILVAGTDAVSGKPACDSTEAESPRVTRVEDIDNLAYPSQWGPVRFVHPEYSQINRCAYFDYQRQRVYVRTSKTIRKSIRNAGKGIHHNARLRASKRIEIASSRCPFCKSAALLRADDLRQGTVPKPRVKRTFDLVITGGGIKRRVIECRSTVHKCQDCDNLFLPPQYDRLDKHHHSLKSWAIFQHIAYGISFRTLEEMFREFFNLHIFNTEIHMFKSLMANYYRPTYRRLLKKILSGIIMHTDETEVKLQTGKRYVTVLANLQEVVFMMTPTRVDEPLRKLLKDFQGVLITDFHVKYDFYPGPQQKCLIHLMRDMNQDLLNNPYDDDLQLITQAFGIVLRSIVETIDQHGLRKRFLKKHWRDVARFFQFLSTHRFQSEAATSLRDRLIKNQDRLFIFTRHDGVPWNNNNAENAIKRFAKYRQKTSGTLKEVGLADYLVLLSIYLTCRLRGVSFLQFLLSRERDLDVFCERRRRKRRLSIQMYPKGYTPPHLVNLRMDGSRKQFEDTWR
jgi:predicted RecB family nuclease